MKRIEWSVLIILILVTVGCTPGAQKKPSSPPAEPTNYTFKQDQVDHGKKVAEKNNRVEEATVVHMNDELFVGLKVTNFDRFFLKSTRKDVYDHLRKEFPQYQLHITTDSKLVDEIKKVEEEISKNPLFDKKKVYQKLTKIEQDMKQ